MYIALYIYIYIVNCFHLKKGSYSKRREFYKVILCAVSHIVLLRCRLIYNQHYPGPLPKVLGSSLGECHIINLFRCVLSFSATLAKRWKVQFRLGLAINSTTLILITAYKYPNNTILYIYRKDTGVFESFGRFIIV